MPTAQSNTPQAAGDLFNFNLQRCDIRQIHRIRFHNPRALHDCLRSVQARQAGAARLHRQAAQLKAVAVFKPAVRGRVDDEETSSAASISWIFGESPEILLIGSAGTPAAMSALRVPGVA